MRAKTLHSPSPGSARRRPKISIPRFLNSAVVLAPRKWPGATAVILLVLQGCTQDGLPRIPAENAPTLIPEWRDVHRESAGSDVTRISVFGDYLCGVCASLEHELLELQQRLGDSVAIEWRHYPALGSLSEAAAIVAECGREAGKFPELHHEIYSAQSELAVVSWTDLAIKAGIQDSERFEDCIRDPTTRAAVQSDKAQALAIGVTVTPSLLLDSLLFMGSPSMRYLRAYVDKATNR